MSREDCFRLLWIGLASIFLVLSSSPGCGDGGAALPGVNPDAPKIRLTSPAFTDGGMIPREFTCDGADTSPPLEWSGVPQAARALALICDDPDAPVGTWAHWVLYDLSAQHRVARQRNRGGPRGDARSKGRCQTARAYRYPGQERFRQDRLRRPLPTAGVHRYFFRLYALDQQTELAPGATRTAVFKAIAGHILADGHLMGKYSR